tara:strand:+ start:451 stop:1032 length:582 start_codon:yes stop_codon:yes gene_type:complete
MNRLLAILILTLSFQTLTKADEIKDFQIEGISIGDSLLDYFTEDVILKDTGYYDNDKFVYSFIYKHPSFRIYDSLSIAYKPKDKKFTIYSIEASIGYRYNIDECHIDKKEIVSQLVKFFDKKKDTYQRNYSGDKSGESKSFITDIDLGKKDEARVICYDISEKLTEEKGWWDRLSVIINTGEFSTFLSEKAYN